MKLCLLFIAIIILEIFSGGAFSGLYEDTHEQHWLVLIILMCVFSVITDIVIIIVMKKMENRNEEKKEL